MNNIIQNSNEKEKENENEHSKNLSKALAFLISEESKEISLELKKKFLLSKLPEEIVNEALEIYPNLLNINNNKNEKKSFLLSSLFDVGIITSSIVITLLMNYLLDVNREKKNEIYINNIEKKLNEENENKINDFKNDINNTLNCFVQKKDLSNEINNHLELFSQGKGLTVNLSLSKVKSEIENIKNDMIILNTKIENNNILVQNIKDDIQNISKFNFENVKFEENEKLKKLIDKKESLLKEILFQLEKIFDNPNSNNKINIQNESFKSYDNDLLINILKECGLSNYQNSQTVFFLEKEKKENLEKLKNAILTLKKINENYK
jgi:hypothetical protein